MDSGQNRQEYTPLATGDEVDDTGMRVIVKHVGGGILRVEQQDSGTRTYSYAYGAGGSLLQPPCF